MDELEFEIVLDTDDPEIEFEMDDQLNSSIVPTIIYGGPSFIE